MVGKPHKLTSENMRLFCEVLSETCNVTKACEAIGASRVAVYKARNRDPDFKQMWDDALRVGMSVLEDEATRRAVLGDVEPIFDGKGNKVGERRRTSDVLLMFLLKAHDPARFRDNHKIELTGKDDGPVQFEDTERAARLASVLARLEAKKNQTEQGQPEDGSDLV